jgi:hypothetical protein
MGSISGKFDSRLTVLMRTRRCAHRSASSDGRLMARL